MYEIKDLFSLIKAMALQAHMQGGEFLYTHEFIWYSCMPHPESRTPFVKEKPSLPEAAYGPTLFV
jgi:hypothetical protein